ncbi:MAG: AraC family transcriptional regulator [Clostridiales bacterium]|jgi:AraC-like DNA-binding protein|nr:AraC family transcriptional regulator [Clostridiales bacterium]
MNEIDWKLALLQELAACVTNIYFAAYDADLTLLSTNSPHESELRAFFSMELKRVRTHLTETRRPVLLTNSLGMAWIAEIETKEDKPYRVHAVGPVFLDDFQTPAIEGQLERIGLTVSTKREFMNIINNLPVVNLTRFFEYGIMLHFCLTGESIHISDFGAFQEAGAPKAETPKDSHGTYRAQERLLRMVEEGNLGYRKELDKLSATGRLGDIADKDYLRRIKNAVLILTALCANAAIHGGVSSDIAYGVSDRYIQNIEACGTLEQLTALNLAMVDDFVRRVHKVRQLAGSVSPQIRECCDLISLRPEENVSIHALASRYGYADYYFSNKFKKETGMTVRDFIMKEKISRACEFLAESSKTIQEICDMLGFASQSHFGQEFRKTTGKTPSLYRKERGGKNEGGNPL